MDPAIYRHHYRLEWQEWLAKQDFDLFVTLNFNRDATPAGEPRACRQLSQIRVAVN